MRINKIFLSLMFGLLFNCRNLNAQSHSEIASIEPPLLMTQSSSWPVTIGEIPLPDNFVRVRAEPNSFAAWLRARSLLKRDAKVMLYNGKPKPNQSVHAAVLDIDVGNEDLQQCADAILRLRTEYLFERRDFSSIAFRFTSGHIAKYTEWRDGARPIVVGNNVTWIQRSAYDESYTNFRRYLNTLFRYAGTASLARELKPVQERDMQIGDVFIQGGFPGHAMIVVDMAEHQSTQQRIVLLAQSYMPAQQIHIVKNKNSSELSPWYNIEENAPLITPEWTFKPASLRRF